jgi:hypothetical protein
MFVVIVDNYHYLALLALLYCFCGTNFSRPAIWVRGRGNGKLVNIIILYRIYRREAWRLERIGMMDAVERLVRGARIQMVAGA